MKLAPEYKLEKALSKDKARPVLTEAYLDVEAGVMVATDSHCLAVVPCETQEGDTTGTIPAAAITAGRKQLYSETVANESSVELRSPEGVQSWPRLIKGQYPDYQSLVDMTPDAEPIAEFGIDAAMLARLAEALGASGNKRNVVRVKVYSPLKPIRVEQIGGDAYGIAMPYRLP